MPTGASKALHKIYFKLLSIMSENNFCDIYRIRNPDNRRFTWCRKTPLKQNAVETVDIIPPIESDHSRILTIIYIPLRSVNEALEEDPTGSSVLQ